MRIEKTVLIVDDDNDDLEMLQEALNKIDGDHKIIEASNGEEGLSILKNLLDKDELPCLIVLDLNMPKLDGKQTFLAIKEDENLSKIPVVIFSTSTSQLDKTFFEKKHTAYFEKPVNFESFTQTASIMLDYCNHGG